MNLLRLLPATANDLRHALSVSHEAIYAELVRLYDRGFVRIEPRKGGVTLWCQR